MPPSPLGPRDHRGAGPFVFESRLGRGGFGVVYLGVSGATRAAVKILDTDQLDAAEVRRRLASELSKAQLVAPFVTARVLDFNLDDDPPYIATEYIDGPTLADAVDGRPLGDADLQRVAAQTLLALEAIHEAGVIHRDFKPGNVMLGSGGIRVIDFGISRGWDTTQHTVGQQGTLPYMAPEQFRGEPITSAVDLFAWGSTMVYVGTGHLPWGEYEPEIINRILHAEPTLHGLEGRMRDVVLACLRKDPATRPSAAEAGRILLRGTKSAARSSAGASVPGQKQRRSIFRRKGAEERGSAVPAPVSAPAPAPAGSGPASFSTGRASLPTAAALGGGAALGGAGRIPGVNASLPGGGHIPGMGGSIPGMGGSIPGAGGSIPGGGRIPGVPGSIPGAGGSIPGMGGSIPGGGRIPGMGGTLPGMSGGGLSPGSYLPSGMRAPLRPPTPPTRRGPWLVLFVVLALLLGAGGGAYKYRDRLPFRGGERPGANPTTAPAPAGDELTAFSAAWPAEGCRPEPKPPAGQERRTNCRAEGGIAVYLILYEDRAARDARREGAIRNALAPQRVGVGPTGARGPYVEFKVNAKTVGLWWDDGASRPDGRTALLLHMPNDKSKEPGTKLRDAWLGQGFKFDQGS